MIVQITRTDDRGDRHHIATFSDLYHALIYIKAHLDSLQTLEQDGEINIAYKYEKED